MNLANTYKELKSFLENTIEKSSFLLEEVKLLEQNEWFFKDGVLSHKTGGFFHITGLKEPNGEHLVLYQPQGAFNGLILKYIDKKLHVLLQSRVEPGNSGIGQYGPTVQSTPANYLKLHGGKATPYLESFMGYNIDATPIHNSTQLDLGKRYYQKTKILSFVYLDNEEAQDNFIWANINAIKESIHIDNFFNTDLKSMIGVFDWDNYTKGINPEPFSINNLKMHYTQNNSKLIKINDLSSWIPTEYGVENKKDGDISAKLYKVKSVTREKTQWYQPLLLTKDLGIIQLYFRKVKGNIEYLLSIDEEFGISGLSVVNPTVNLYGEEEFIHEKQNHRVVYKLIQSEEGGRFFKNENEYSIIEVDDNYLKKENQIWVSVNEFKQILSSSNQCSIQLRCISSLVVDVLNPNSFN
jgi:oxidase EvaA